MRGEVGNQKPEEGRKSPIRGLGGAITTLTLVQWPWRKSEDLSDSLPWFPLVGLFVGLILYGIGRTWSLLPFIQWPAGVALVMVAVEVWVTRGLHLDGLADWADSAGGLLDREKRLAIMKDVRVGTFGILALILVLAAKWLALERLLSSASIIWLLTVFTLSRGMMVELITTFPYARTGEGMARPFVKGASQKHRIVSHCLSLGFCLFYGPLGFALFGLAGFITWLFGAYCRRQYGGITGDLLGTANEIVEVGLLMTCALPGKTILNYTGWSWVF